MKRLLQSTVLCACLYGTTQAGEITLTVNQQEGHGAMILSDQVSIGTNEVAQVTSIFGSGAITLRVIKNGITNSLPATGFSPSASPVAVAGPATLQLVHDQAGIYGFCFCTVKIKPESFPPGQTIILPQGTVGVIHVESSTNLIQWQDEWTQTFSNTNQNRFFRLRAERSLL
jgi:hypothetical protein